MLKEIKEEEYDNAVQTILSYLKDEESQFIFQKRLEYNHTHDFTAIRSIVERCVPELAVYDYSPEKKYATFEYIRNCRNVWIWGAGIRSERLLTIEGSHINGIIDIDINKVGKSLMGVKIYSPDSVDFSDIDCLIASMVNEDAVQNVIHSAVKLGMDPEKILIFNDFSSKTLEDKQYFEDFMKCSPGEVFVDGGALNLNTTMRFMKHCSKFGVTGEKSIAFEPDIISFEKMKNSIQRHNITNVEVVNAGLYSSNTTLRFNLLGNGSSSINENGTSEIKVVTVDSHVKDKVTFIKMDIEGAELEALKGCRETIISHKPKLAICVYHKPEDIIEIPLYIKSLVPEYQLYMRHYSNSINETVLYAVI